MFTRTILAATFAIGLGASAFAQTPGGQGEALDPTVPGAGLPAGWDQQIGDAFFSDPAGGTLRSQEEISANWVTLTAEQQAQVRLDCSNAMAGAAGQTTTGDAGAAAGTDDTMTSSTTGEAGTAGAHMAAMSELCDWVETQ